MRAYAILATIYAATVGTASEAQPVRIVWPQNMQLLPWDDSTAALVDARERTTVGVYATNYTTATSASGGCNPAGCVPEYTRDNNLQANSRWSCQGDGCCITYTFEEAQDIVKLRIGFHEGDERTRTLDVYDNGDHDSEITSSGNTLYYETFYLSTDETEDLKLCLDGDDDEWISITEVRIMVQ